MSSSSEEDSAGGESFDLLSLAIAGFFNSWTTTICLVVGDAWLLSLMLLDNNNMLSCGGCKRMRSSSSSEDTRISHFHHLVAWLGVDEWNFSKLHSDVSSLDSSATEYEQGFVAMDHQILLLNQNRKCRRRRVLKE
ncbi:hypothetical protein ACFE04_021304 [Oxalis oulophora]